LRRGSYMVFLYPCITKNSVSAYDKGLNLIEYSWRWR
jgi:hypothetical protein